MKNVNWKFILGIILGVVVAGSIVGLIEGWGHSLYPIEGLDMTKKEDIAKYAETAPPMALVFPAMAWVIGAFFGSFAASLVAPSNWRKNRFWIAAIILAMGVAMLVSLPSTWYMWLIALLCIFPFSFLGTGLARMFKKA